MNNPKYYPAKMIYESDVIMGEFDSGGLGGAGRYHTGFKLSVDEAQKVIGGPVDCPGGYCSEQDILVSLSNLGSSDSVLDFGCGMGTLAVELAPLVERVVGLNISERQLARAQLHTSEKVSFELYDGRTFPFEDDSFDVVLFQDSIVHAPFKEKTFSEIRRVLRSGGRLVGQDWLLDIESLDLLSEYDRKLVDLLNRAFFCAIEPAVSYIDYMKNTGFEKIRYTNMHEVLKSRCSPAVRSRSKDFRMSKSSLETHFNGDVFDIKRHALSGQAIDELFLRGLFTVGFISGELL